MATTHPTSRHTPSKGGRRTLRLLLWVGVFTLVLGAVLGVRSAADRHRSAATPAVSGVAAVPTSPAIEQRWGVRFTGVTILADGGVVELRYIALDPATAGRLHSGSLANLPVLVAEDSGKTVRSSSQMFGVHTAHAGDDVRGRSYSVVYGNADAAIRPGGTVSIVLADGLRLDHVPVS
jgi:hypothetical protein